jgi:hypothetical protein
MRRGSFDLGSDEGRERRYEGRDRGEQAGRGGETWYREGSWELPADQDIEWRGMRSGGSFDQGPFAGRGPRGYRRSDQAIFEEVCERLTAHGYIDATEIDVEVQQGIVTLTGIAPDRRQKRLAEQAIENIAGVQDVSNQVRLASRAEERTASDAQKERSADADDTDRKAEQPTIAEQRTEAQAASGPTSYAASQRAQTRPAQSQQTSEQKPTTSEEKPTRSEQEPTTSEQEPTRVEQEPTTFEQKPGGEQSEKARQPVGVMGETRREQQSEMTTPRSAATLDRSAAAVDRSDATQADRRESMSGERGSATASGLPDETATEARTDVRSEEGRDTKGERPGGTPSERLGGTTSERLGGIPSDSIGQRNLDAPADATGSQPATHEVRINAGSPVYGREGDKIGEVAEGTGDYFVVHKGLIFATELYIPAASIIRSDDNGVQVDISKEELANYKDRPTTVPT